MAQVLATPGVYIEEKSAFPSSAVQVATAVPAFVGYTERALKNNKSIVNKPTRLTSLSEYHQFFGGAPKTTFTVAADDATGFSVAVDAPTKFNLYRSMRLFFANGGSVCYIVSAGDYSSAVSAKDLNDEAEEKGIPTLLKAPEPTMLVIPDAVLLEENDCASLQQAMLMHCGNAMKSRVAILDVFNGDQERSYDENDIITKSREGLGNNFLQWGASYYPYVNTTIVQGDEVDFSNVSNLDALTPLLDAEADAIYGEDAQIIKDEIAKLAGENDAVSLNQTLMAKLPLYKAVL